MARAKRAQEPDEAEQTTEAQAERPTDGRVWLAHPDIDADPHWVPDDPSVIEHMEARGWHRVEAPAESTWVVPELGGQEPPGAEDAGWVEMEHPDLDGRRTRFPNDPAVIRAQEEAGWRLPDAPEHEQTQQTAEPAADSTEE